jgi:hypothetical protein
MAKTQSAAKSIKSTTPAIVKAPKLPPAGTRQVAAGAISGPKGKPLVETKPDTATEVTEEQRQGERRQAEANAVMQFTGAQLTTPAAHAPALSAEQQKMADFKVAQAKLAEQMGIKLEEAAPAPVAAAKANKLQRNGITRPAAGTTTGKVWACADAISASQNGMPASIAQLKASAGMKDMNDHTLKTQYSRWRQYNGVKGRQVVVKPVAQEGAYEGMPHLA